MKRYLISIILCIIAVNITFAQAYTSYWANGNGLSGKIVTRNKIIDYKDIRVKELRFYNSSSTPYNIIGYVKLKYTEICSGKTDYKEKRFQVTVKAHESYGRFVSSYFSPSWSRYAGYTDQVSFYIESCTPLNSKKTQLNRSVSNTGGTRTIVCGNRAFYYDSNSKSFIESDCLWIEGNNVVVTGKRYKQDYGCDLLQTTAVDNEHNSYWYIREDCVK